MASSSASPTVDQRNQGNSQRSHFQKTICLVDWWLIKAENGAQGTGLAVAGISSHDKQAVRVFSSAPILRRYDVFTLETIDGICVILDGIINKDNTLGNGYGFPSNVCDFFTFGFPPYWKEYHDKFLGGQMPADSSEKDFGSQGKMNDGGTRKRKNVESLKNSLSEKTKAFGVETRRKSETPDGKKKSVPSASPDSISISRSRSGRLRMPTLEFWRNQRPVYDADRSITEIEQGISDQPIIIIPKKKGRKRKQT